EISFVVLLIFVNFGIVPCVPTRNHRLWFFWLLIRRLLLDRSWLVWWQFTVFRRLLGIIVVAKSHFVEQFVHVFVSFDCCCLSMRFCLCFDNCCWFVRHFLSNFVSFFLQSGFDC